ncbi:response regulator receiver domain protein [Bacteriovorax sp. BSW11_IV]|uniref:response regulator n=1 Tax=Bacteriovorax sp. BSW11_IV TaxID=1353529 RepID=UPI00038A26F0|nr:response regulator [Bacteriovorax sp. BSW11_IV]EQC49435.1 response regulator receiver domain protein [Bacteriovorax sp. BSW11_IV]
MRHLLIIEPDLFAREVLAMKIDDPFTDIQWADDTDEALFLIENGPYHEIYSPREPPYMLCFDFAHLLQQKQKEITYTVYFIDKNNHVHFHPIMNLQGIDGYLNSLILSESGNFKGPTVLFADDDDDEHLLLERLLRDTKPNIIHSYNATDVVDDFKLIDKAHRKINLVLLDLEMPGAGLNACRDIRKYEQVCNLQKTPIFALTAVSNHETLEQCHEKDGFTGYIYKPFVRDFLRRAINDSFFL